MIERDSPALASSRAVRDRHVNRADYLPPHPLPGAAGVLPPTPETLEVSVVCGRTEEEPDLKDL